MPIAAECPSCAYKGRVPEAYKGRKVKCPWCDQMFTVGGETASGDTHYPGVQKTTPSKQGASKPQAAKTSPQINLGSENPFANLGEPGPTAKPAAGGKAPSSAPKKAGGSHPGTQPAPKLSDSAFGTTASPMAKKKMGGSHPGTQPAPKLSDSAHGSTASPMAQKKMGGSHPGTPFANLDEPAASPSAEKPKKKSCVAAVILGILAFLLGLTAVGLAWFLPEVGGLLGLGVAVFGGLFGLGALAASRFRLAGLGAGLLGSGVCALALVLTGQKAWEFVSSILDGSGSVSPPPSDGAVAKDGTTPKPPASDWVDASEQSAKVGPFTVRVIDVTVDYLKGKNLPASATQAPSLQVRLTVLNNDAMNKPYRSWAAPDAMAQPILTDDAGTVYKRIELPAEAEVVGQTLKADLGGGDAISDVLVFEAPKEMIQHLRLELPAGNLGEQGAFKFHIPREIITFSKGDKPMPPMPVAKFDPAKMKEVREQLKSFKREERLAAVRTLYEGAKGGSDVSEAVPELVLTVEDLDEQVRLTSAMALGLVGKQAYGAAVPALIRRLEDPEEVAKVRLEAARSLGQIGPPAKEAVAALMKLVDDADKELAAAAQAAIKKIDPNAQ